MRKDRRDIHTEVFRLQWSQASTLLRTTLFLLTSSRSYEEIISLKLIPYLTKQKLPYIDLFDELIIKVIIDRALTSTSYSNDLRSLYFVGKIFMPSSSSA